MATRLGSQLRSTLGNGIHSFLLTVSIVKWSDSKTVLNLLCHSVCHASSIAVLPLCYTSFVGDGGGGGGVGERDIYIEGGRERGGWGGREGEGSERESERERERGWEGGRRRGREREGGQGQEEGRGREREREMEKKEMHFCWNLRKQRIQNLQYTGQSCFTPPTPSHHTPSKFNTQVNSLSGCNLGNLYLFFQPFLFPVGLHSGLLLLLCPPLQLLLLSLQLCLGVRGTL